MYWPVVWHHVELVVSELSHTSPSLMTHLTSLARFSRWCTLCISKVYQKKARVLSKTTGTFLCNVEFPGLYGVILFNDFDMLKRLKVKVHMHRYSNLSVKAENSSPLYLL